jgi:peptidoglycan/LPS O-acetylase OafA/YrhL
VAIADPAARSVAGRGAAGQSQTGISTPPEHQNALDGLRVIAALAVLAANVGGATGLAFTGSPLSWIATRGDVGVPVFFALSGYLLYRPWASAVLGQSGQPEVRRYVLRRILRIVPAYWIVVAIALIFWSQAHVRAAWTWVQYLFLLQNYDAHPWWSGTGAAALGQMWSLVVDVSFYAALPLLAAALTWTASLGKADLGRRARRLLAGIAVLGISSYGFLAVAYRRGSGSPWFAATLPSLLTWFAVGMALAVLSVWAHAEPGDSGPVRTWARTVAMSATPLLLIAALLFVISCTPVAGPEAFAIPGLWGAEIKAALYTLIAAAVIAPAAFQSLATTRLSAVLGHSVMRYLARISYGIFLWQGVAIVAIFDRLHVNRPAFGGYSGVLASAGLLMLVAVVTCVTATASYFLIERPALIVSRRVTRDKVPLPPEANPR